MTWRLKGDAGGLFGRIGKTMSLLFNGALMPDKSLRSRRNDFLIRYAYQTTAIVNAQVRDQVKLLRLKEALTVTTATPNRRRKLRCSVSIDSMDLIFITPGR